MLLITQTGSETHPEHQAFETENVTIYHENLIVTGSFLSMNENNI